LAASGTPEMSPALRIRHFTDPACPWAFSAEPARLALRWLYGDALGWEDRMVVLSSSPEEYLAKGFTPGKLSTGLRTLQRRFDMPIDPRERPRMAASEPACRAVVAARLRAPGDAEALLRRLRVLTMAGGLLDDPELIARAAREAGLDPAELGRWSGEPDVEEALAEDMRLARAPDDAALALDHKLAEAESERGHRYTCPSYEIGRVSDGERVTVPGFQPLAAYEVAVANLAPELERHPAPESAAEALDWAGMPLAAVEVAALCQIDLDEAREQLARVAREEPVGTEGWWELTGAPAPA